MRLLLAIAICMLSAATSNAATRAEFDQLVQHVQAKPNDNALRERVIKMAQELKPAPAISEEARRYFVQGNTFAKSAKDASGQKLAIDAYNDALKLAPWWGEAYYNLALSQELAGRFSAARASMKLYLLTKPREQEAREARDHIYALEAKEKLAKAPESGASPSRKPAAKPQTTTPAPAPSPAETKLALLRSLNGAKYYRRNEWAPGVARDDDSYVIMNEELMSTRTTTNLQENLSSSVDSNWHWQDGEFRSSVGSLNRVCLSADGQQLTNCVNGEVLGTRTQ